MYELEQFRRTAPPTVRQQNRTLAGIGWQLQHAEVRLDGLHDLARRGIIQGALTGEAATTAMRFAPAAVQQYETILAQVALGTAQIIGDYLRWSG